MSIRHALLKALSAVMVFTAAQAAQACTVSIAQTAIPLPASIAVTASRSAGLPLTDWTVNNVYDLFTGCTGAYDGSFVGLGTGIGTYSEGGQSYTIFPTGTPGIGIVYAVHPNRAEYAWTSVEAGFTKTPWVNTAPRSGFGWIGRARLIELQGLQPGTYPVARQMQLRITALSRSTGAIVSADMGRGVSSVAVAALPVCTVRYGRGRVIDLGNYLPKDFPSTGSTSPSVDLGLSTDCGMPLANIHLKLAPATALIDGSMGRIAVGPGGAEGLDVQIVDTADTPVSLLGRKDLGSATGSALELGLRARLYRSPAALVPGKISSGLTLTFEYD